MCQWKECPPRTWPAFTRCTDFISLYPRFLALPVCSIVLSFLSTFFGCSDSSFRGICDRFIHSSSTIVVDFKEHDKDLPNGTEREDNCQEATDEISYCPMCRFLLYL